MALASTILLLTPRHLSTEPFPIKRPLRVRPSRSIRSSVTPAQATGDAGTNSSFGPSQPEDLIKLTDVRKLYGNRAVVDGVSLVVGLLGPNGAGKSTTFNMAVGREAPSAGRILIRDKDVTRLPLDQRARLGIGYMTQESSVFRNLSVSDNLMVVLEETGAPKEQRQHRLKVLLEEFGLTKVAHTKGCALSGGERRRTELARALAAHREDRPVRVLFMDEPFAGVDPLGVAEIQGILRKLRERYQMGILITDHDVHDTLSICDRAYMMYNGRVMADGVPSSLYDNAHVRQYYLGDAYFQRFAQQ
eukprot:jgi/Mesvir1/26318/Mv22498-RA.2